MKAEFRSDQLEQLPDLIISASDEIEWRALQLFMKLLDNQKVRLTFEYFPSEEGDSEEEGDSNG